MNTGQYERLLLEMQIMTDKLERIVQALEKPAATTINAKELQKIKGVGPATAKQIIGVINSEVSKHGK